MKPIAVISDTHRGIKERLAQSPALESFLDFAKGHGWQLILNGDIIDLWAQGVDEVMDVDGSMIERIAAYPDFLWLPGNHDEDHTIMRRLLHLPDGNISSHLRIGKWIICHGYQFDPLLDTRYERAWASLADRISYELSNLGPFNAIRAAMQHSHRDNAPLIERSEGWGNILMGHSHFAVDQRPYINSGCWTGEEGFHYVLFDAQYNPELIGWEG
jgi:UDP-2,3-diacylglucosamine pyrophosphatase LpxH